MLFILLNRILYQKKSAEIKHILNSISSPPLRISMGINCQSRVVKKKMSEHRYQSQRKKTNSKRSDGSLLFKPKTSPGWNFLLSYTLVSRSQRVLQMTCCAYWKVIVVMQKPQCEILLSALLANTMNISQFPGSAQSLHWSTFQTPLPALEPVRLHQWKGITFQPLSSLPPRKKSHSRVTLQASLQLSYSF